MTWKERKMRSQKWRQVYLCPHGQLRRTAAAWGRHHPFIPSLMVAVAKAIKPPPVNQRILDCFWSLASENEQERVEAPKVLCEELDNVDDEDSKVVYVCNRLITGLSSSRAAARQGFALAITVWLKYRASKTQITQNYGLAHTLASRLEKQLDTVKLGETTEALREAREAILGTLFGIAALAKTELIGVERVLAMLQRVVSHKKWSVGLTEAVLQIAIESLSALDSSSFRKKGSTARKAVVQWIKQRGIQSADAMTLALSCRNHFGLTNLTSECQFWGEENPVVMLMKEEESPLVTKADVKNALETVFSVGSHLPRNHVPFSWFVWLDPLSNAPDNYFNEWWNFFIRQLLLQTNSSGERILLGVRLTIALIERNLNKKEMIMEVMDASFLFSLLTCCRSSKEHVKKEAVSLKEKVVTFVQKHWDDELCKYLVKRLYSFALKHLIDRDLLSWSATKLSPSSVTELCDEWRKEVSLTENILKFLCIVFSNLSSDAAQTSLFSFILEKILSKEDGKKWKDSVLNAISNAVLKQDSTLVLLHLAETAANQYKQLPFHRKPKVNRIYEFCRQQIIGEGEQKRQDRISETLVACSLGIFVCLFSEEEEVDEFIRDAWPFLKKLTRLEGETDNNIQQEEKSTFFVKFLVVCLSLESHGLRQLVKYVFGRVIQLGDESILSLLVSFLPGNVQWKELCPSRDAEDAFEVETSSVTSDSESDESSFSSNDSDSSDGESSHVGTCDKDESNQDIVSFDVDASSDFDVDKNPDEEDTETLEAYDARIAAMLKEMNPNYSKNSHQRMLHEALRVLDLIESILHSQMQVNATRIQLPNRLWLSVIETNESDLMNRVYSILQKQFLRESIVPSVPIQHYLNEMQLLKKILDRFYGADSKLLSDEVFRLAIYIFAYLLKGMYRRYKWELNNQTDSIVPRLSEQEGYPIVKEMIRFFTNQSLGITRKRKAMENTFSMARIALLEENLWQRVLFTCYEGVKCICSAYKLFRSRVMKRTALGVLQTAVKLICSNNKRDACAKERMDPHEKTSVSLLQDEDDGLWLETLRSFLVARINSFRLQHYHDLFAKCLYLIHLLSRNGYNLGEDIQPLLYRKLEEYPDKDIPPSVKDLFKRLQKDSLPFDSHSGKRDATDLQEYPSQKRMKQV